MIDVMERTEHRFGDDLSTQLVTFWSFQCTWSTLSDRSVWAPLIEVGDIFGGDGPEMLLIENEQVIQTFGPQRSHPALGDGIGARRSERSADLPDAEAAQSSIEGRAIATVTIMNEEPRCLMVPATAFDKLLCHPLGCRMLRYPEVQDFPAGVMNDEEDVERPEEDCLDAEEVTGPDC